MSRFREQRRGISLLEVLLTLVILALVLVPVIRIFSQTHRMGHSAKRLVDVVVHAQGLVEAVSELDPTDFPPKLPPPGQPGATYLLQDEGPKEQGPSAKWKQVHDYFDKKPPIEGMKRELAAERLASGEVQVWVTVRWTAVQGEEKTEQELTLPMLCTPRNWQ